MAEEKVFKRKVTLADVMAHVENLIGGDRALTTPKPEVAEITDWWNLFAYGPIQPILVDGPFAPHQVIKLGETAYVVSVLALNTDLELPGGITAAHILSDFALPYEIKYQTANLSTWALSEIGGTHTGNLIPGQSWYTDILEFTPTQEGLYEMNVLVRLLGAFPPGKATHFGGFAHWIGDLDPEALWPVEMPIWHFELPIKFMVYA